MSIHNPSAPPNSVTPVLVYDDVRAAVEWLTPSLASPSVSELMTIGRSSPSATGRSSSRTRRMVAARNHRTPRSPTPSLVPVHDVDAHHRTVRGAGARVRSEPTDLPFGERQYSVVDPGGHLWTFTELNGGLHLRRSAPGPEACARHHRYLNARDGGDELRSSVSVTQPGDGATLG
jgi:predicted enzyme related to lactoylglutathione lyase